MAGGDTAWEEERNLKYAKSEVRLAEITDQLCKDLARGNDQCHEVFAENEDAIEEWWTSGQDEQPQLYDFLCIEHLKVCCPAGTFGENCTPCPGGANNPCYSNGKCIGEGSRKGNGRCECNQGYNGEHCMQCAEKFYEEYRDSNKLLCTPCHRACAGGCTGIGPETCKSCAAGWRNVSNDGNDRKGCGDIDECLAFDSDPCAAKMNGFCVNTEGSYRCLECDRACDGCDGQGPDFCLKCAAGYELDENNEFCVDTRPDKEEARDNWTRYLTYLGLCIATFIIFQKNVMVAGVIGLVVATYVSFAEWYLSTKEMKNFRTAGGSMG